MNEFPQECGNGSQSRSLVGIDLGTTNSLVAVFLDGRPQLIPNVHGTSLTPSIVGLLEDGRALVGDTARNTMHLVVPLAGSAKT